MDVSTVGINDRVAVLNALTGWVLLLVVTRVLVPWTTVPPLLWGALAAIGAFHVISATLRVHHLPLVSPGKRPVPRVAGALVWAVVVVALLAA